MAISPFTKYANASLTFEIRNGDYTIDPTTGNPIGSTTSTTVKAILNPGNANPKYYAGTDEAWEFMEGYWVDPLTPPDGITPGMTAAAVIITSPGSSATGTFKLMPVTQDPYVIGAGVNIITPIKGLFRRQQ